MVKFTNGIPRLPNAPLTVNGSVDQFGDAVLRINSFIVAWISKDTGKLMLMEGLVNDALPGLELDEHGQIVVDTKDFQ